MPPSPISLPNLHTHVPPFPFYPPNTNTHTFASPPISLSKTHTHTTGACRPQALQRLKSRLRQLREGSATASEVAAVAVDESRQQALLAELQPEVRC